MYLETVQPVDHEPGLDNPKKLVLSCKTVGQMSWKGALTMTCSSLERGVVEVFQHRQVYLLCVGTESPSQSGREHGTPFWCVVPKSGRVPEVHEARGTLTGIAIPMRSRDSSDLLNSFPLNTPIPGIVPYLRLFPRPWGSSRPLGAVQSRPALEERAPIAPGCFRTTPVNLGRQSGESSLSCSVKI